MGLGGTKNILTDDDDPRHVYHNLPIALDSARDLNNGQPAALAKWMDALGFKTGNRVFHLGCGVGYYSAIIAEVVSPGGSVLASEIDPDLAARAKANLKAYPNVEVHSGDGAKLNPGPCDAILINAGVTHPHAIWLDGLRENGRLLLPLTIPMGMGMGANLGKGVMVKIIREPGGFSARVVTFVGIYSCASLRDPQLEPLLGKALASGALLKIKSLGVTGIRWRRPAWCMGMTYASAQRRWRRTRRVLEPQPVQQLLLVAPYFSELERVTSKRMTAQGA
jgi:protein-L-isoaspartate(D-aspartate) O-methyltransferase